MNNTKQYSSNLQLRLLLKLLVLFFLLKDYTIQGEEVVVTEDDTVVSEGVCKTENCENPDKPRMITEEELAKYVGKDNDNDGTIWLSILGEVYDVTAGKEYYGPNSGEYSVFAGRDASTVFVTGEFTEESAKNGLDTIPMNKLGGIEHWRKFYQDEEKYKFVGRLIDTRFYDIDGNPTQSLIEYTERLHTFYSMQDEKKEKLRQRREMLKKKRLQKEQQEQQQEQSK